MADTNKPFVALAKLSSSYYIDSSMCVCLQYIATTIFPANSAIEKILNATKMIFYVYVPRFPQFKVIRCTSWGRGAL